MDFLKHFMNFFFSKKKPQNTIGLIVFVVVGLFTAYQQSNSPNGQGNGINKILDSLFPSASQTTKGGRSSQPKLPAPDPSVKIFKNCDVTKIPDGDTLTVVCQENQLRVRLYGLDAPEKKQEPWGEKSRLFLSNLIGNNKITIEVIDTDMYQRKVARIFLEKNPRVDINLEIIKTGNAIVYTKYNKIREYQEAGEMARANKLGVWSKPGAHQDPEKWRRLNSK